MELMQTDDTRERLHCTIFVEENDVMISRRMPVEMADMVGFIEWNRFCDRVDDGLEPLRALAETKVEDTSTTNSGGGSGGYKEQSAKTTALESLQRVCDKLAQKHPEQLQFTLYCPFHSPIVSNWHIQVTVVSDQSAPPAPASSSELASSSEMTETIPTQISESTAEESSDDTSVQDTANTGSQETTTNTATSPASCSQKEETSGDDANTNQFYSTGGKGVLGVDYMEHTVLPTDTFKGICLAYNVRATRLRQVNLLSGDIDSLSLAPKVLAIPISDGYYARVQDTVSKDFKLTSLKNRFPKLASKEAKAYLELADWVLEDALETAREDIAWEKEANDGF